MALKATIFKAELQIAEMDRNYCGHHALTLSRHPSETDERMMVRLLTFAPNASEDQSFCKGLSTEDEAELWRKDLTGAIELWIKVGLPDEKSIRKACGRAAHVRIYSYGGRSAELWWNQLGDKLERCANLGVIDLLSAASQELARLAMRLQCTIQDGQAWLTDRQTTAQSQVRKRRLLERVEPQLAVQRLLPVLAVAELNAAVHAHRSRDDEERAVRALVEHEAVEK